MSDGMALSMLDWWVEAGADTIVEDQTCDWLAATARPAAAAPGPEARQAAPAVPQDLPGLRRWLLADASIPGPPAARIDAVGDTASGIVVVVDMPETADRSSGTLLSGPAGALFDRMLGAIGLARAGLYLLPLSPARPPAGKVSAADAALLVPVLRHHLELAAPKRLLLLGDAPVRALIGLPLASARGTVRTVALAQGDVTAVASFHPRLVLERPDYRKPAWADLQLFMGP